MWVNTPIDWSACCCIKDSLRLEFCICIAERVWVMPVVSMSIWHMRYMKVKNHLLWHLPSVYKLFLSHSWCCSLCYLSNGGHGLDFLISLVAQRTFWFWFHKDCSSGKMMALETEGFLEASCLIFCKTCALWPSLPSLTNHLIVQWPNLNKIKNTEQAESLPPQCLLRLFFRIQTWMTIMHTVQSHGHTMTIMSFKWFLWSGDGSGAAGRVTVHQPQGQ